MTETERGLLDALSRFSSAVAKTGKTLRVSQLTEYAFDLATSFTNFYEHPDPGADVQTPFIHLQDQESSNLSTLFGQGISKGDGQYAQPDGNATL